MLAGKAAMEQDYAFSETDEVGKANLASFAARSEHRSSYSFMPMGVFYTHVTC
jgi:hypothetical protein